MLSISCDLILESQNQYRNNIHIGDTVLIVQKMDQKSGKLTRGIVFRILTNKSYHSRGIKVQLQTGEVGRVQKILKYKEHN